MWLWPCPPRSITRTNWPQDVIKSDIYNDIWNPYIINYSKAQALGPSHQTPITSFDMYVRLWVSSYVSDISGTVISRSAHMSNVVIILTRLWLQSAKLALICNCIISQNHRWQPLYVTVHLNLAAIRFVMFFVLMALCGPIHTVLLMSRVYIRDAKEQLVEQLMK